MAAPARGKAWSGGCLWPGREEVRGRLEGGETRGEQPGRGLMHPSELPTDSVLTGAGGSAEGTLRHLGQRLPHLASQPFICSRDGHSFLCSLNTSECPAQRRCRRREANSADKSPSLEAYLPAGQVNRTSERGDCCGAGSTGREAVRHGAGQDGWARDARFSQGPREPDVAQTLTTCKASGSDG